MFSIFVNLITFGNFFIITDEIIVQFFTDRNSWYDYFFEYALRNLIIILS